jgi:Xaa-Pro dipeptidase
MTGMIDDPEESLRVQGLLAAQAKALALFEEIEATGLIAPGIRESDASNAIRDLAGEMFGIRRYWHKRVVRAGVNTLEPYRENPPDRLIGEDDIVFADFGPIFQEWEADFGRTFVLGADPVKLRLRDSLAVIFDAGRDIFEATPDISGAQLYAEICRLAQEDGWSFGNVHAGHLVGEFPHELIDGERIESYVAPGSDQPMRGADRAGRRCHWILEVHLIDPQRQFGGFYEELLDLGVRGGQVRS